MSNNSTFEENMDIEEKKLFELLSHTHRRQILRLLHQHIFLAYKDLKKYLEISTGTLYHHLEKLGENDLIFQDEHKQYRLTNKGRSLVQYIQKIGDNEVSAAGTRISYYRFFKSFFLGEELLRTPKRMLLEISLLICILILIVVPVFDQLAIVGPFLVPRQNSTLLFPILEIMSFLLVMSVIFLTSIFLRPKLEHKMSLVAGLLVLPLSSLLGALIVYGTELYIPSLLILVFWLINIILQVFYSYVIVHLLVTIKRASLEAAVIINLVSMYVLLVIVFVLT